MNLNIIYIHCNRLEFCIDGEVLLAHPVSGTRGHRRAGGGKVSFISNSTHKKPATFMETHIH